MIEISCTSCGQDVPASERHCPACQTDMGYPNVRKARSEAPELAERFRRCIVDPDRDYATLEAFMARIGKESCAVMTRKRPDVEAILEKPNAILPTYRQRLRNSMLPEGSSWDIWRPTAEAAFFSGYEEQIHYAILSLEDIGPHHYGDVSLVFKETMIAHRATVYEENTGMYPVKNKVPVGKLGNLPKGRLATWRDRGLLCAVKLAGKIDADTGPEDHQGLLVCLGNHGEQDDFVEVHIYGTLNRQALTKVIFHQNKEKEKTKIHRLLAEVWREELKALGIEVKAL